MNFWSSVVQFLYSVDWEKFWGVVLGGLVAGAVGYMTQLLIESHRRKIKRRDDLKKLLYYLRTVEYELDHNITLLENAINNHAMVDIITRSGVPIFTKVDIFPKLVDVLPTVSGFHTELIKNLHYAYDALEAVNSEYSSIQKQVREDAETNATIENASEGHEATENESQASECFIRSTTTTDMLLTKALEETTNAKKSVKTVIKEIESDP